MLDLISREMAKEAIRKKFLNISDRCEINEVLNSIPAVDAVPVVHGQWNDDDCCSECGQYVYQGDMRNYCPCCGAKMDAKHPEPVYPTWFEWFKTVVPDEEMLQRGMYWDMQIPADIAQKLGIEPKEK